MTPRESVDAPRQHHQWLPDRSQMEPALHKDHATALEKLKAMGHEIDATPRRQGDAHSIFWDEAAGSYAGIADQRRSGTAAGR
jgi:gamma-glutamyltranspeptidase/glutathione hydrolase